MAELFIVKVSENNGGQRTAVLCYDAADPQREIVEVLVDQPNANVKASDISVAYEALIAGRTAPANTPAAELTGRRVTFGVGP